jgi:hypothetical protein
MVDETETGKGYYSVPETKSDLKTVEDLTSGKGNYPENNLT